MTRALTLIALILLVAGMASAQDGLWFCNYQSGTPGITKYGFDGTRLVDVPLTGSICYAAAVDYARNVWVTTSSSQALKIDSSGLIQVTASTGTSPQGVAVDAFDNLFVVSRGAKTVTKFDPFGKAVATGQTPKGCLSCIVDAQGQVWVPVFDLGSSVPFELYRYDNNLQNRVTFTFTPSSTSSFGFSGIACDTSGDLYVANQARSSVMKILSNGAAGWETPIPAYARGMAMDVQGHVWAAGHAGRALFKLRASDGALLATFQTPNSSPLSGALVDANSDVWSLGNVSPVINKWDRAGGVNLVQRNERAGSTVAMGESSGYHSAVVLNGGKDFDGDGVNNLPEAMAGSNFLDQFCTPTKPTPIVSGDLSGGSNVYLGVRHLASAGKTYAVGLSFGTTPGIPIPGVGTIPLNLDNLLIISLQLGAPLFNNMLGGLDGQGDGLAWIQMPTGLPSNLTLYAAFITFDAGGIHTISNPVMLVTP